MKNVVTDPEKVTRILKTATEIFGQQGFIKSKTDQIANQAQVSKGGSLSNRVDRSQL